MSDQSDPRNLVTFMTADEPVSFAARDIFQVLDMYRRHGKEQVFRDWLDKNGPGGSLEILLPKDTVNALKLAVASDPALRDDPIAQRIMNPPQAIEGLDTFSAHSSCCGFSSGG
ncbi:MULTISPECIES: hypothetical protein [Mesorhizobium]|uniref:Uncharacterized protein n=1 Tax=Mesorhizobium caraganae TaxID=483206 RepID=A0ABV1Z0H5_9HYPH|nr:hypothetical protein [Mesorhizobium sp. LSJC277A00]ESW63070.1 hypothetical protein X771_31270 [Mesorhizobium sp. LSJC277A00]